MAAILKRTEVNGEATLKINSECNIIKLRFIKVQNLDQLLSRSNFGEDQLKKGYSKFYLKRLIQIQRVELSTKISHVKIYPDESSPKNIW